MRMKTQRTLAALLMLVMLLSLAPMSWATEGGAGEASPAEPSAMEKILQNPNTITVNLAATPEYADDIANAKVVAELYLLADVEAVPGFYSYQYKNYSTGVFDETLKTEFEELLKTEDVSDVQALFNNIGEVISGKLLKTPPAATYTLAAEDGAATIELTGVKSGLYMLVLRGKDEDNYAEIVQTEQVKTIDGEEVKVTVEKAVTKARSDDYTYLFTPQLLTVPAKRDELDYVYNTASGKEWVNNLQVNVKATREPRNGQLKIVKTLTNYVGTDPATFVFKIEATYNGEKVFSDVRAISLTGNGSGEVTISKLPVGATVTVTEVYSGSRYTPDPAKQSGVFRFEITDENNVTSFEETKDNVIPENPKILRFDFYNTHDGTDTGGYGIENQYTYQNGSFGDIPEQHDPMNPVTASSPESAA